jgi:alpha-amylase
MNGVLLQGFHWFLPGNFPGSNGRRLWQFLKDEADHYREVGIDAVWIPPAYKAEEIDSVGYDVYDHFDTGEFQIKGREQAATKYGTKTALKEAIEALHGDGTNKRIQVYADIVLNHKTGGETDDGYWDAIRVELYNRTIERWGEGYESGIIGLKGYTKFEYKERAGAYSSFAWSAKHFDSIDTAVEILQNGKVFTDDHQYIYRFLYNEAGYLPHAKNFEKWVSLEKGNYDFFSSCDFDYGRYDVREEMKYWGKWFVKEFELDGFRLDAVKHISTGYIQEWLGHVRWKTGKELFAVAEYMSGDTFFLHEYLTVVTNRGEYPQQVSLFDFPLFFKFRDASQRGESYDLRSLAEGTLMAEQPALAVTFVENHDYEFGRDFRSHVETWFKPLAYAFILLRSNGFPCIFFPDYYGSANLPGHQGYKAGKEYLALLIKLRKQFGFGEERYYAATNVAGWIRMGFVEGAKGAMAVVINTGYNKVLSVDMDTGRVNKAFYHLATIKWFDNRFLIVNSPYHQYANKSEGLWTNSVGRAAFVADGGSVSIWLEEGTTLS